MAGRFIFVVALSQFSGPDYLGAWNRLLVRLLVPAFSLKIRLVLISASAIANHDVTLRPLVSRTVTLQRKIRVCSYRSLKNLVGWATGVIGGGVWGALSPLPCSPPPLECP